MRLSSRTIDEYTLAAYLAGRLSPGRRREVAEFLANDEEARSLLRAAGELLESEGDGQQTSWPALSAIEIPSRRKPILNGSRRLNLIFWSVVGMVCVTAFLTTTFVALRIGLEAGSPPPTGAASDGWAMHVIGPVGALAWDSVPGADRYHITYWVDGRPVPVAELDSDVPYLAYAAVENQIPAEGRLRVWVDAFDRDDRLLRRTRSLSLRR